MRRRKQIWLIVESKDGDFAVMRGGRAVVTGASVEMAKSTVRKYKQPEERVWLVEPDGYRTEITKSIDRAGAR